MTWLQWQCQCFVISVFFVMVNIVLSSSRFVVRFEDASTKQIRVALKMSILQLAVIVSERWHYSCRLLVPWQLIFAHLCLSQHRSHSNCAYTYLCTVSLCLQRALPVRKAAARSLLVIMRYLHKYAQRAEIMAVLIEGEVCFYHRLY